MSDPAVKVTFTVTVEMTREQRQAYETDHGVGFVEAEVLNRVRPDAERALQTVPWLARYTTITLSKPIPAGEGTRHGNPDQ